MKIRIIFTVCALSLFLCGCGNRIQEFSDSEKASPEQGSEQGSSLETEQGSEQGSSLETEQKEEPVAQKNVQEGSDEETLTASREQVMEAYQQILHAERIKINSEKKAGNEEYGFYVLGDVNQDGIDELMVMTGSCEADEIWKCYSYNGDSAYQVGDFAGGHTNLCSGEDGIYTFYAQMGYVEISKIIWEGGTEEIKTEITYTCDTNYLMEEDYDALIQTFALKEMERNDISDDGSSGTGGEEGTDTQEASEPGSEYEVIPVVEGSYWEGDTSPYWSLYYIQISNGTSEGFDFEIFGRDNVDDEFSTVFKYHTAVYTSPNSAVYYGQNYTLTFRWTEQGYLSVDGFAERIPSEDVLYNSDYLGVS